MHIFNSFQHGVVCVFFLILSFNAKALNSDHSSFTDASVDGMEYSLFHHVTRKSATQQARLIAEDGTAGDSFGYGVAIFGNTALVGAYSEDIGDNIDQGAVYVFSWDGSHWTQQAKLVDPNGAAQDYFGISVALSGDTALVGAFGADTAGNVAQGSACIFTRSGGLWTLQTTLAAVDAAEDDLFGFSVALVEGAALVGAPGKTIGVNANQGAAYVFSGASGTWQQQAMLVSNDGDVADLFGSSVAMFSGTAIVGAYLGDAAGVQDSGTAYVFSNAAGPWTQQAKLVAADGAAGDQFGVSVAIGRNTALVGASLADSTNNPDQGSAYVFTRAGTTWTQHAKLFADDGIAFAQFGVSVALSGGQALVGAPGDNENKGAAYLYRRDETVGWHRRDVLTANDGEPQDYFGISVAAHGDIALAGAFVDQVDSTPAQGSTYVFDGLNDLFADGFE